jgi:hypothetical protein
MFLVTHFIHIYLQALRQKETVDLNLYMLVVYRVHPEGETVLPPPTGTMSLIYNDYQTDQHAVPTHSARLPPSEHF